MFHHDEAAGPDARIPVDEPGQPGMQAQSAASQSGAESDDPSELRRALLLYGTAGKPVASGGTAQA